LYTVGIEHAAGHTQYFILVESIPGKYRKAVFLILSTVFGWTNLAIINLLHVAYVSPAVGVGFFVDSNGWNVNGTPNLRSMRQMLRVLRYLASENVLTQPSALFRWVNQISSNKCSVFVSMAT